MAVETYALANTACDVIFCDSNFLIDLCIATSTELRGAYSGKEVELRRANDAVSFYTRYRKDHSTEFISSPLALEEVAHKLQGIALKKTGYHSWKELRRGDHGLFDVRRAVFKALVDELENVLKGYEITFVVPKRSGGSTDRSQVDDVCKVALHFFKAYDLLDAMDAFHVSMAVASGARWIASSDEAMEAVAEISNFTGLRASTR